MNSKQRDCDKWPAHPDQRLNPRREALLNVNVEANRSRAKAFHRHLDPAVPRCRKIQRCRAQELVRSRVAGGSRIECHLPDPLSVEQFSVNVDGDVGQSRSRIGVLKKNADIDRTGAQRSRRREYRHDPVEMPLGVAHGSAISARNAGRPCQQPTPNDCNDEAARGHGHLIKGMVPRICIG
jgi:hypothetical protein